MEAGPVGPLRNESSAEPADFDLQILQFLGGTGWEGPGPWCTPQDPASPSQGPEQFQNLQKNQQKICK